MLQVNDLTKSYGNQQVLKGISFSLQEGESLVIMGPSGSGKSTAVRCLNCLTKPDSGEIIFNGTNLLAITQAYLRQLRQEIGFVFQNFNLIARLTVLENVILPLLKQDLNFKQRQKKARRALKRVKLAKKETAYPADLSGGQKQRVGIARSLAIDPSLILLDEPTASLDPILVKEVLTEIEHLTKEKNRGIVLVTHEVNFALRVADRILLLDNGQIVERGTPNQILITPQSKIGEKYKELVDFY